MDITDEDLTVIGYVVVLFVVMAAFALAVKTERDGLMAERDGLKAEIQLLRSELDELHSEGTAPSTDSVREIKSK